MVVIHQGPPMGPLIEEESKEYTRADLIALRDAGDLVCGNHYLLIGHNQGDCITDAKILLHATGNNTLGHEAKVLTSHDNSAWFGRYDIDAARIIELRDNRDNVVEGAAQVTNFDWGNPRYNSVRMTQGGVLRADKGQAIFTISRLEITRSGTVDIRGARGAIFDSSVSESSLLDLNGSSSNATIDDSRILSRSIVRHIGVSTGTIQIRSSEISNESTVTHSAGAGGLSIVESKVSGDSIIGHQTSTLNITASTVDNNAQLSKTGTGNATILSSTFTDQATIAIGSSTTTLIYYSRFQSFARLDTGTTHDCDVRLFYCTISERGYININAGAAGFVQLWNTSIEHGSFFQKLGSGPIYFYNCSLRALSRIYHRNDRQFRIYRTSLDGYGQLDLDSTGAGIDYIFDLSVLSRARVRFRESGANNRLYYSVAMTTNSTIEISGTTTGLTAQRLTANGGYFNFQNNVGMPTVYGLGARDGGNFLVRNNTARRNLINLSAHSIGYFRVENGTVLGNVYYCGASENGSIFSVGAGTTLYYSSARNGGRIYHNGGRTSYMIKELPGVLTTGPFNHNRVYQRISASQTLTANNTNTGRDLFNNSLI